MKLHVVQVRGIWTDFRYYRFAHFTFTITIHSYFVEYVATGIEENHLWKCYQLGSYSPQSLLCTLIYFNMKHFGLMVCVCIDF